MLNKNIIALIFVAFLPVIILAQEAHTDLLRLRYTYNSLEYENTIRDGRMLLTSGYYTEPQDLIYIHKLMAYSQFNLGLEDSARVNFFSILSIDPEHRLDAVSTSPKILDFFALIKEDVRSMQRSENTEAFTRYIFVEDLRPGAAWRSALFPGWGQYYKSQNSKAYILGGSFVGALIFTVVSHSFETTHRQKYLDGVDPEVIADEYNQFNNWSKTRRAFTYLSAGIWIASFADALWSDYPRITVTHNINGLARLSLNIPF